MDKNSLAYASYWRNSLADADLGFGGLKAATAENFTQLSKDQLASGCLGKPFVDACFKGESEKVECVEVVIRPKVYRLTLDYWWLVKKKTFRGSSKHILELYDHLRGADVRAPLFDQYARAAINPPEPCLSANAMFSERLGHASSVFSLAETQRNALSHLLAAREGEILAVNGPPGTGKTTLLLSVVASLWAKAAIDGREPPVILAASTNNQAVLTSSTHLEGIFPLASAHLLAAGSPTSKVLVFTFRPEKGRMNQQESI
jgi:hypothetical protein